MLKAIGGFLLLFLLVAQPAQAQFATSSNYQLEIGENLETLWLHNRGNNPYLPFLQSAPNATLLDLIYDKYPTPASISTTVSLIADNSKIDFGRLMPGNLVKRETILTVNASKPLGYQLFTFQEKPFVLTQYSQVGSLPPGQRAIIPATGCDSNNCTIEQAGAWSSEQAFGFGYSVAGVDALADFAAGTAWRPFVLLTNQDGNTASGTPVMIATNGTIGQVSNRQLAVSYQVNVPELTEAGSYLTSIGYVLIPNF